MGDLENLPDLPPATAFLLVGLIAVLWLAARVAVVRRARGEEDASPPVRAWSWLVRLSRRRGILPLLLGLALLLAAAVAATLRP